MKNLPWKQWLPAIVAIISFIVISIAYCSPVLEGKQLVQGDKRNWQGMAQEVQEHRTEFSEEPLWTGSMFSGMPAYQVSVRWSSNLMLTVHKILQLGLPRPASYLFMYMLGMFILLRCLRIDPWLSLIGAVAFALSSYFVLSIEAGHNSKVSAIAYMPVTFAGLYVLYRRSMLWGAALFAFFLALEISMNHVQITYYLGFVMVLFGIAELVRAVKAGLIWDFMKRSSLGLVAVALALLCNLGSLWSTWEYGQYTTRGQSELTITPGGDSAAADRTAGLDRDYITDWSYGIDESLTLLVPNAQGGPTGYIGPENPALNEADQRFRQNLAQRNQYWGDQRFTSGPSYLGAVIVLLLFLCIGQARGKALWWALAVIPVLVILVQLTSPLAAGVMLLTYLLAGAFLWKDTLSYALFSALTLTLVLAWGRNYMPMTDFFIDFVPGYSKFRAVTMILVIVEMAAVVLGVLYLDRLLRSEKWGKLELRAFLIPTGVLLVLLASMIAMPNAWTDLISDAERTSLSQQAESDPSTATQIQQFVVSLKDVRAAIFSADATRSFGFVLIAGLLIFLFGKRIVQRNVLVAGIGLLIIADLWVVDKRYLNNEKNARGQYEKWEVKKDSKFPFAPTKADNAIYQQEVNPTVTQMVGERTEMMKAQKEGANTTLSANEQAVAKFGSLRRAKHYRVLNIGNPFNDSKTSYFHRSIGGYHGAKLKRYQQLIEFQLQKSASGVQAALQSGTDIQQINDQLAGYQVLNMLNTRYLVYSPDQPPIQNLNALGPAWFVGKIKWVKNADEEITALGTTDLSTTAVVDERFKDMFPAGTTQDPSASVSLVEYRANMLKYSVSSSQGGTVVFSEIHYDPDWQAYIDGQPVTHVRANFVLRAIQVPAGEHTVEFKVESVPYKVGSNVSMASSILLILLMLGMLYRQFRGNNELPEKASEEAT